MSDVARWAADVQHAGGADWRAPAFAKTAPAPDRVADQGKADTAHRQVGHLSVDRNGAGNDDRLVGRSSRAGDAVEIAAPANQAAAVDRACSRAADREQGCARHARDDAWGRERLPDVALAELRGVVCSPTPNATGTVERTGE